MAVNTLCENPDLAQLGRAPDLGSGGRVFESLSPDQTMHYMESTPMFNTFTEVLKRPVSLVIFAVVGR